jgi:hypothetical protein
MSILDTFYILFESDASKLDKGLADSEKKAEGLTKVIAGTDAAAGKLGNSLLSSLAELGGAVAAAFALKAMASAMFDAADQADALSKAAQAANASIEEFAAWSDIIKKNGGSVDGFAASLGGLNAQLVQLDVTGKSRAAPFLKELGINLDDAANKGKTAMDFLPQLADAFEGMDTAKAIGIGKRLGLDQATIMTLQAGRREIDAMIAREKELGTVTQRQAEISEKFNDTIDDTSHAFRSIWLGVAEYVLPPLTWMMEKFQTVAIFMRKHSDFVVGLMIAIGAAIAFYALPPLFSMAAAVVAAFAPFILAGVLVAALATAFALLYDDIMNFVNGGDSMLGQIVGRWPIIGEILKALVAQFVFFWDIAKAVGSFLVNMFDDPAAAFDKFKTDVSAGLDRLIESFPGLKEVIGLVTDAFTAAGDTIMGVWDAIVAAIKAAISVVMGGINSAVSAFNAAKSFLGLGNDTRAAVAQGQAQLGAASRSPMVSQTSNSISNSTRGGKSTSVQVGKVEVHTQATDAAGISKAIGGTMQTQMRQAVNNYDDGVLA